MKCRHCHTTLQHKFLDLGFAPPSNAYLDKAALSAPETYFPLRIMICHCCWLAQTEDFADIDAIFNNDYAYFSSTSKSWLAHAATYAQNMIEELQLSANSHVIEVASNDGYLLKNFTASGIPCLGIEPTASTAAAARALGIPVWQEFFGTSLAHKLVDENKQADLIIGNNVYAHVPDINDFTQGLALALKPGGTITVEFPHLLQLLKHTQFDTVYHEHFSYLALGPVQKIFAKAGLRIWKVEELSTHGGSLRIFGCHTSDARSQDKSVDTILRFEETADLNALAVYEQFQTRADTIKNNLLTFLLEQKKAGKTVAAYGAAAKGNTLLNYAGIRPDLLSFVCDAAPSKQGKFMPGSHIPILSPDALKEKKPDCVLILPWNLKAEIMASHNYIVEWGGKFAVAVPSLDILS